MFKGLFPGIKLTSKEADALLWVLEKKPWWCTEAMDFPLLITTSRDQSIAKILLKLSLESDWHLWTLFDKFCLLILTLSGAIPTLNDPSTTLGKEEKAFMEFINKVKELIDTDSAQDMEDEYIAFPGATPTKEGLLPNFETTDDEAENLKGPSVSALPDFSDSEAVVSRNRLRGNFASESISA